MSQVVSGASKLSPEKMDKLRDNSEGWDTSMLTVEEKPGEDPEIMMLRQRVKFLEQLLDEKERLITVLMDKK